MKSPDKATYYKANPGIDSFDIDEAFAKDNTEFLTNQLLSYINTGLKHHETGTGEEKSDKIAIRLQTSYRLNSLKKIG